ncbi:MAG TPA: 16S rRNA (uracil(1498)-N(3))-methyltransferase [Casimicrobiaceae bacterium]|jgi:16S rRNA (uracil1498-N3)-methyltransferase|nr:16S rRNA (uracil(1498)-N(3))-methyltransferase [Casimicrobiaceae bacterium]
MTPRIYVGDDVPSLAAGDDYPLPPPAARHIAQALRMRSGDALTLFTGNGGEYVSTIVRADRRDIVIRVARHDAIERESPHPVVLVQSLIAADMMDLVVRKAVELGATAIVVARAARSQSIASERAERRVAHWRKIAIAACEQCGRNRIPDVAGIMELSAWLDAHADAHTAILDADASRSLAASSRIDAPRAIAVGPEGGFAPEEVHRATARGALAVHLGRRVLRAETAAIAALATLDAIAGDAQ